MGERADELKGRIKEGTGKLTDNERLNAEGQADAEGARAKRKTRGTIRQTGGKVEEGFGALAGDDVIEAEGRAQRLRGEAEKKG